VLPNKHGNRTTPSYVGVDHKSDQFVFGETAVKAAVKHPEEVAYDLKRLIGPAWDKLSAYPFTIGTADGGGAVVTLRDVEYTPQERSTKFVKSMRDHMVEKTGVKLRDAVITVPAGFTTKMRQITYDVAIDAGFTNVRLLSEPTAGVIAYVKKRQSVDKEQVLVFDLG
jgi:molecular chaperone DnaK